MCVCLLCYHCTADDAVVLLCLFSLTLSTVAFQSFFHFSTFLFFISFFYSFLFVDYSWAEIFIFTSALPLTASLPPLSRLFIKKRGGEKKQIVSACQTFVAFSEYTSSRLLSQSFVSITHKAHIVLDIICQVRDNFFPIS